MREASPPLCTPLLFKLEKPLTYIIFILKIYLDLFQTNFIHRYSLDKIIKKPRHRLTRKMFTWDLI